MPEMVCMRRPYRWLRPMRYTLLARPTLDDPYIAIGMVSSVGRPQGHARHPQTLVAEAVERAIGELVNLGEFGQAGVDIGVYAR